ncbi:hypothetical protein OW763_10835 [Clostridium aestuarii]|uniref:Uncharacterized protein n=1 Tax=Clostridium aestuarii TaxID=338193 RepID=A0ABT4D0T0_9CLOT|nr:hypothetical protein [Clostridium aestuarii]MCY6484836.1 hypothetical protein [Clostridium aestuarii]
MDKLMLLYNVLDKARKMKKVKTKVEVKINHNNKIFDRKFIINIDGDKIDGKNVNKRSKVRKSRIAYVMMFIDIINRIIIKEGSSRKLISLKIKDFDELTEEANEIIKDYMENSKGIKNKFNYMTDMLASGSSTSEILDTIKEFKKLDISMKDIEPKALAVEIEVDNNLNMNSLKLYGKGIHVEDFKPVVIEFKEKFM